MTQSHRALRRALLHVTVAAVTLASVGAAGAPTAAREAGDQRSVEPAAEAPNIVFVLADDLDAKAFTEMPSVRTLVADQGTTFDNYLVTTPLCCPSRASMLRGQYSHNTGVWGNSGISGGHQAFVSRGNESSTVGTWLDAAGYTTAFLGKYMNGYPTPAVPRNHVPPGWDNWFGVLDSPEVYRQYGYQVNNNGTIRKYGHGKRDYLTDVLSLKATKLLDSYAGGARPFLMMINPTAPHSPYVPANRHKRLFEDATYPRDPNFDEADVSDKPAFVRAMPRLGSDQERAVDLQYRQRIRSLQAVDEMVSALIDKLESTEELDNTLFFVGSDNGFHLGEHRLLGSSEVDRDIDTEAFAAPSGGKNTAYQEDIRIPLFVRGPNIPAGVQRGELVGNIDIAPTIADAAGVDAPGFVDGRSFLPLLHGDEIPWRTSYLIRSGGSSTNPGPRFLGLRTATHSYVEYTTDEYELYDLVADPFELENFYPSASEAWRSALHERLDALGRCAAAGCRAIEDLPEWHGFGAPPNTPMN